MRRSFRLLKVHSWMQHHRAALQLLLKFLFYSIGYFYDRNFYSIVIDLSCMRCYPRIKQFILLNINNK